MCKMGKSRKINYGGGTLFRLWSHILSSVWFLCLNFSFILSSASYSNSASGLSSGSLEAAFISCGGNASSRTSPNYHRRFSSPSNFNPDLKVFKLGVVFAVDDKTWDQIGGGKRTNFRENEKLKRKVEMIQAVIELSNHQLFRETETSGMCFRMIPIVVPKSSTFVASQTICKVLCENGGDPSLSQLHAIVGPPYETLGLALSSLCQTLDIPYLELHPSLTSLKMSPTASLTKRFSVNFHPMLNDVHTAIGHFLLKANWTRVGLVFDAQTAMESLLLQDKLSQMGIDSLSRRITHKNERTVIQELKMKNYLNVLMDFKTSDTLSSFLESCQSMGFYSRDNNFVLASLRSQGQIIKFRKRKDLKSFSFYRIFSQGHPTIRQLAVMLDDIKSQEVVMEPVKNFSSAQQFSIFNGYESKARSKRDEDPPLRRHQLGHFYLNKTFLEHSDAGFRNEKFLTPYFNKSALTPELSKFLTFEDRLNKASNTETKIKKKRRRKFKKPDEDGEDKGDNFSNVQWDSETVDQDEATVEDQTVDLELALLADAIAALAQTASNLNHNDMDFLRNEDPQRVSCDKEIAWDYGTTFLNFLNAINLENGITGRLSFQGGKRENVHLELMRYSPREGSTKKLGDWTTKTGLTILENSTSAFFGSDDFDDEMETLLVVTKEERPYVMINDDLEGNDRFEGFAIDLLKAISDTVGFKFKLYTVPDHLYGFYDHDNEGWNGIVKELIDRKADLAVASMTINYARENAIDFTKPFMNLGISILFKAPKDQPTELFSFMNPLALDIWFYILFAYILVSMTIWIVARFSPYEWASPHPCDDKSGLVFQNDFTLPNAFWFAIGTLMQQGSDLNPKAASTRIVGGIWWFFTLIIISSYTANLAAFLTVERMATPIESAEDLSEQSDIKYGTLVGGSTMTFFRDSKAETYAKMWRYMESNEAHTFVQSYEEGVERVLKGNYAFLSESTMIDYLVQRNCNLTQIGGLLDSKGYGIATPKQSKWKDKISQSILFLQEKGVIQMYYDKWWKHHRSLKDNDNQDAYGMCNKPKKTVDQQAMANALGVVHIGGIFVVLLVGLAFAIIIAIIEFCWSNHVRSIKIKKGSQGLSTYYEPHRVSLCQEVCIAICSILPKIGGAGATDSISEIDECDQNRNIEIRSGFAEASRGIRDREEPLHDEGGFSQRLDVPSRISLKSPHLVQREFYSGSFLPRFTPEMMRSDVRVITATKLNEQRQSSFESSESRGISVNAEDKISSEESSSGISLTHYPDVH